MADASSSERNARAMRAENARKPQICAILLITSSVSGNSVIFHYPRVPVTLSVQSLEGDSGSGVTVVANAVGSSGLGIAGGILSSTCGGNDVFSAASIAADSAASSVTSIRDHPDDTSLIRSKSNGSSTAAAAAPASVAGTFAATEEQSIDGSEIVPADATADPQNIIESQSIATLQISSQHQSPVTAPASATASETSPMELSTPTKTIQTAPAAATNVGQTAASSAALKSHDVSTPQQSGRAQTQPPSAPQPRPMIFGMSLAKFADILPQKAALCNAKFEMWLDHFTIVGHPVLLNQDGHSSRSRRRRLKQNDTASEKSIIASAASSPSPTVSSASSPMVADGSFTVPRVVHTSIQTSLPPRHMATDHHRTKLKCFSLMVVLGPQSPRYYRTNVNEIYESVVLRLSKALKQAQDRNQYVSQQSGMILRMKEQLQRENCDPDEIWSRLIASSSLAHAIEETYEKLKAGTVASLQLGRNIKITIEIPRVHTSVLLPKNPLDHPLLESATPFDLPVEDFDPDLAKKYALLLVQEPNQILRDLGHESNSVFARFIQLSDPNQRYKHLLTLKRLKFPLWIVTIMGQRSISSLISAWLCTCSILCPWLEFVTSILYLMLL